MEHNPVTNPNCRGIHVHNTVVGQQTWHPRVHRGEPCHCKSISAHIHRWHRMWCRQPQCGTQPQRL